MIPNDTMETTTAVEQAVEQMDTHGTTVKKTQLEHALTQLRAESELSDAQRRAVERLSERLVERLLSVPRSSLQVAARSNDKQTVETAIELFG